MADTAPTAGSGTARRGTAAQAPRVDTGRPVQATAPAAVPLRCLRCQGAQLPSGPRAMSVDGTPHLRGKVRITLDGADVTDHCLAADPDAGVVALMVRVEGKLQFCGGPNGFKLNGGCGCAVAAQLYRGRVEVVHT